MGLNLDDKKAVVAEVSAQVAGAQTIVLAEYKGVNVAQLTKLRAQARKSGVYLRVVKNTLVRRAVAGSSFEGLAEQMTGPLIYGISGDPVAAAKVLNDFAKANDKLVLKAGCYAGKVMDKGLWRYTRHPNYFGDACVWWGLYLIAAETGLGAWALPGPLLMTFLLTKWSGVPTTEGKMRKSKPGYEEYVARTSGFVPWFPKKG